MLPSTSTASNGHLHSGETRARLADAETRAHSRDLSLTFPSTLFLRISTCASYSLLILSASSPAVSDPSLSADELDEALAQRSTATKALLSRLNSLHPSESTSGKVEKLEDKCRSLLEQVRCRPVVLRPGRQELTPVMLRLPLFHSLFALRKLSASCEHSTSQQSLNSNPPTPTCFAPRSDSTVYNPLQWRLSKVVPPPIRRPVKPRLGPMTHHEVRYRMAYPLRRALVVTRMEQAEADTSWRICERWLRVGRGIWTS
jgi:hypothetical protein